MSQSMPPFPPAMQPTGYGPIPAPRRGSGAAVASLGLGLIGCVPFLTSLLAIILGIVGIRKTRDPAVGGKGLAIAGLVLGIVDLLRWSAAGVSLGYAYLETKKASPVAEQFLRDVCAGKVNAAVANSSGMTSAQLQANVDQLGAFGTFQGVSFNSFNINKHNGQASLELGGIATFSKGTKTCTFILVKQGTYKVIRYQVQ
jgi:hypothetical protein